MKSLYVNDTQLPMVSEGAKVYKKYARRHPYLKQDLYCEMTKAVIIANQKLATSGNAKNPAAYVRVVVKGYLQTMISRNRILGVNIRTYIAKGGNIVSVRSLKSNDRKIVAKSQDDGVHALHELLESCYKDERERDIISMVVNGEKSKDIGERLHLTRQRVQQIVSNFRERVEWKLKSGEKDLMRLSQNSPLRETSSPAKMALIECA